MEKHPLQLKSPDLQTSSEVTRAVRRQESRTGETLPNDPSERIDAYISRLEDVFLNEDSRVRSRNLELFKPKIYRALLTDRDNFPESYFELQQRVARERGQAVEEIPQNIREQMKTVAIEDQRHSLDAWMDYLTSPDAVYPAWFKYLVWQNVTKLSQFDKERGEFKKRTKNTVAPFPDIYREPLAQIADKYAAYPKLLEELEPKLNRLKQWKKALQKAIKVAGDDTVVSLETDLEKANDKIKELSEPIEEFTKQFPVLYAELIQESLANRIENKEQTAGKWVKYNQGEKGAATKLYSSLEHKGTGWCTAGKSTAEMQIGSGDFYVYYTNDPSGAPTQPRLAIRMDGADKIGEVRGILPHQNVEPLMQEVLDAKLAEFGKEADAYRKKSADMKLLTEIDSKCVIRDNAGNKTGQLSSTLTRDELLFIYEINSPIESFGYGKNSRIAEVIATRNKEADMLVVFDCTKEKIANAVNEIRQDTKAYIGQLEPGIFQKLPDTIEHIYTSFPEGKIRREQQEIGGKTAKQYADEIEKADMRIYDYAKEMMDNKDFITLKNSEQINLVRLTVKDLGFDSFATTDQLFERAKELGLELCPPETGPGYRLSHPDQPMNDYVYVGMKPVADRGGSPHVFYVYRASGGLWLRSSIANPGGEWFPVNQFLFRIRKLDSETLSPKTDKETLLQKLKNMIPW